MKTVHVIHVFISLVIITFSNVVKAQLYEVPLDQRIQESSIIIEGKVINTQSYKGNDGNIYTENEIQVLSLLKGELEEEKVAVITYGGEFEGEKQTWTHLLKLRKNEIGLFCLTLSNRPTLKKIKTPYEVYASSQGFLKYEENDIQQIMAIAPFNNYIKNDLIKNIRQQTGQFARIINRSAGNPEDLTGVEYNIKNISLNGNMLDFDIYIEGLWNSYDLTRSELILEYNPAVLGNNISTNGLLTVTKGIVSNSPNYNLNVSDLSPDKVSIKIEALNLGLGLYTITNIEEQLVHVQLTSSIAGNPDIHFDELGMQPLSEFLNINSLPEVFQQVFTIGSIEDIGGGTSPLISPSIVDFYPDTVRAGTGDTLTIIGTDFDTIRGNTRVKFTSAHGGPNSTPEWISPLDTDYLFWSDTLIKVIVPSIGYNNNSNTIDGTVYAGTGKIRIRKSWSNYDTSNDDLYIKYCVDNAENTSNSRRLPVLLGNSNKQGGYSLYYNPNFSSDSASVAAFERALIRWRCLTRINFKVTDTIPSFNGCEIKYGSLPAGVTTTLGETAGSTGGNCVDTSQTLFVIKYQRRPRFSMIFNNNSSVTWYKDTLNQSLATGTYDLESVSMHELGHAFLLNHSNNSTDLMYYNYGSIAIIPQRNPAPNDVEGALYIRDISIIPNLISITGCNNHMVLINQSDCDYVTPTKDVYLTDIDFRVYPNPSRGIVNLEYLGSKSHPNLKFTLINSIGQVLERKVSNSTNCYFDLSNYSSGIYFITIGFPQGTTTIKVLKN